MDVKPSFRWFVVPSSSEALVLSASKFSQVMFKPAGVPHTDQHFFNTTSARTIIFVENDIR